MSYCLYGNPLHVGHHIDIVTSLLAVRRSVTILGYLRGLSLYL